MCAAIFLHAFACKYFCVCVCKLVSVSLCIVCARKFFCARVRKLFILCVCSSYIRACVSKIFSCVCAQALFMCAHAFFVRVCARFFLRDVCVRKICFVRACTSFLRAYLDIFCACVRKFFLSMCVQAVFVHVYACNIYMVLI